QASGSGADEGTGSIPGVPDAPIDESEEELSWNSTNDEGVDDEGKDGDDDEEDEGDDGEGDGDDDDEDDDGEEGNDDDDDDQEVDRDDVKDDEDEDVNNNQGRGLQVTLEVKDSYVTLTPVNPDGQQQTSSVSSQFMTCMLNPTLNVDFVYQVEHKNSKKSKEMYYLRFTKVIIHHFMLKDPSIPRRNKSKTDRICKGQTTAKASKAKSLFALSEVAMTKAQQLKLVTKRSMQQTHISQASGSGADEGTGSIPGVPDAPIDESEEELSWNSTNDEGVDDEGKDETRDEESFDPIPKPPKNSDDEGDGEEYLGLNKKNSEAMQTNKFVGAVSAIPEIVQRYMDQRMNEAVKVAIQIQSNRLRDEAQRENDEFLKTVDENMQKIIKDQVKEQVKIILDTYGETVTLKRRCDDDADKDEKPSAGPDWGSKGHREGKEPESASAPTETATRSAGRSTQGSQSRQASASEFAFIEEPVQTTCQMEEPSHLELTQTKATDYGHIKWIEDLVHRTMWIKEPIGYDKHALWGVSY
nr:hypothetical protein [Tanacetum cinerariifolium]